MITIWLESSPVIVFVVLVGIYGGTSLAVLRLSARLSAGPRSAELRGVVPQFLSVVAVLFALQAGFLAAEISQRNQRAVQSVASEASALVTLNSLLHATGAEGDGVRKAAIDYVQRVLQEEWPVLGRSGEAPAAAASMDALLQAAASLKLSDQHNPSIHGSIASTAVSIAVARGDRLALATEEPNQLKWLTVLLLAVLTQVALIFPHLGNRAATTTVVLLFSLGTVILLGLMGLQEHSFSPPSVVSSDPLAKALRTLSGGL